jgi:transcriptional regulator with GAF, ATPase, and Fis domain
VHRLARAARAAAPTGTVASGATLSAPAFVPPAAGERRTLAEIEREAIERVLVQTGGRISGPRGAATILGLKPSTLASRMQKLGVRRPK